MDELAAELRSSTGKKGAATVRQGGGIPAVLYGADQPPTPLAIRDTAFQKLLQKAGNRLSLLSLNITNADGGSKEPAIIKAIQRHPVNERIIHIDFLRVSLKKALSLDVPIQIEGVAPGIKLGGVLQQMMRQVQVRCLPLQIPQAVIADISALEIGNVLTVKDLKILEGVELLADPEQAVLSITTVHYEEETAATPETAPGAEAAEAPAQPEVIGEKEREERQAKKGETVEAREKEKQGLKETKAKEEKNK